jgi:SulP family sulfate permease
MRRTPELAGHDAGVAKPAQTIGEVTEPPSPLEGPAERPTDSRSMLATMFRSSPQDASHSYALMEDQGPEDGGPAVHGEGDGQETRIRAPTVQARPPSARRDSGHEPSEISPLLATSREGQQGYGIDQESGRGADLEGQKQPPRKKWLGRTVDSVHNTGARVAAKVSIVGHPKRWDRRAIWQNVMVAPVACLPAVIVGLLLNILDALSYGELAPGIPLVLPTCC